MEKIGTYKLIAGNRVRLNKRAQEILGLEEKGDKIRVWLNHGSLLLTSIDGHVYHSLKLLGERKMYDDGTARWANIPKAARDYFRLDSNSSLDLYDRLDGNGGHWLVIIPNRPRGL